MHAGLNCCMPRYNKGQVVGLPLIMVIAHVLKDACLVFVGAFTYFCVTCYAALDRPGQDTTRQDRAEKGRDRTRKDSTGQGRTQQDRIRQDMAVYGKTWISPIQSSDAPEKNNFIE